jgi:hypothetical protein
LSEQAFIVQGGRQPLLENLAVSACGVAEGAWHTPAARWKLRVKFDRSAKPTS